ncbi:hypothetical protein fugu_010762 [Takifugu bimaculatus]|uniref:Calponin-homology (CH) domain-containing protein n=1 Tax=Takifugu bimaculatus TaxID=433685 RepID=A0A4Z2CB33_9TELE|nr:hypothetical protein fugu_010746 [Takifugu bimaculatus]TNN01380.1 hypothetical protein fugu_010762 [Takifugu bimaculatus]
MCSSPCRNQLSALPAIICSLPLKGLIACNNKLVSLPEELGQLRHLTELVRPSEELSELSLRVAEISRDQRPRGGAALLANGTHVELEQIDFIDSCVEEEEEEGRSRARGGGDGTSLSSQFMAYIERRITREGSPGKNSSGRTEDPRRNPNRSVVDGVAPSSPNQRSPSSGGLEKMRREAHLAALRYDEERQKTRYLQRDTKGEDRAALSPTGGVASCRPASLRPESFLFRLTQKEEKRKGDAAPHSQVDNSAAPPLVEEDAELVEQLRKNIEARLKVSLPTDLGAALTDGVVLCHLANHVRPRSVPSIHVPSPAVPKLTMAKCRRNVENFLEACRRIGVPQSHLCLPLHILEERGLPQVAATVSALLDLAPPRHPITLASSTPGPSVSM